MYCCNVSLSYGKGGVDSFCLFACVGKIHRVFFHAISSVNSYMNLVNDVRINEMLTIFNSLITRSKIHCLKWIELRHGYPAWFHSEICSTLRSTAVTIDSMHRHHRNNALFLTLLKISLFYPKYINCRHCHSLFVYIWLLRIIRIRADACSYFLNSGWHILVEAISVNWYAIWTFVNSLHKLQHRHSAVSFFLPVILAMRRSSVHMIHWFGSSTEHNNPYLCINRSVRQPVPELIQLQCFRKVIPIHTERCVRLFSALTIN